MARELRQSILTESMNSAIATEMTDSDSRHLTTIAWARGEWSHHKGKYSREHPWHFAGTAKLRASVWTAPEATATRCG